MYDFGDAIVGAMIVVAIVAVAATLTLVFGVPWLWGILKPFLHAWTA